MSNSQTTAARSVQMVQRLGKNLNGYLGETIEIEAVLKQCLVAARTHGWTVATVPAGSKPDLLVLSRTGTAGRDAWNEIPTRRDRVPNQPPLSPQLVAGAGRDAFHRVPNIYLSTGIHGDEPAGPLAALQLLQENQWPAGLDLWLCPCLNPSGFLLNRRENDEGLDLNRQYLHPAAPETVAHIGWLEQQPDFDVCLCLHEDWESHGFYVYELNPDQRPSLAEAIVAGVTPVCPIDLSETIEGRPAQNGIIRPSTDPRSRPQWPEAFYLLTHKTRLSYTLEAPSDFPLAVRVAALVAGVKAALEAPVISLSDNLGRA